MAAWLHTLGQMVMAAGWDMCHERFFMVQEAVVGIVGLGVYVLLCLPFHPHDQSMDGATHSHSPLYLHKHAQR